MYDLFIETQTYKMKRLFLLFAFLYAVVLQSFMDKQKLRVGSAMKQISP